MMRKGVRRKKKNFSKNFSSAVTLTAVYIPTLNTLFVKFDKFVPKNISIEIIKVFVKDKNVLNKDTKIKFIPKIRLVPYITENEIYGGIQIENTLYIKKDIPPRLKLEILKHEEDIEVIKLENYIAYIETYIVVNSNGDLLIDSA